MTPLQKKMIKAMELRNLAKGTQYYYRLAVKGIARFYNQPPDTLTQEMIEDYLLYLKNDKGNTPGSCGCSVSGLRFFYRHVAEKEIPFSFSIGKKPTKLPRVLTPEQIDKLINAPRNLKHRLILMTTYSAGLRIRETAELKPEHIDSKQMLINVERGKGGHQRYTCLSSKLLKELPTCFLQTLRIGKVNPSPIGPSRASTTRPARKRASKTPPVPTPCDIVSLRIFWRPDTISATSRPY
jgi:site-specific recombinase XerD